MSKKILLENREDQYKDLLKRQEAAAASLEPLISYCKETLQIEIPNLNLFLRDPKKYCIDAYWEKYGEQFKNSPVQKDKLLTLTAWDDAKAGGLIQQVKNGFAAVGSRNYEIGAEEVKFKADPEEFKSYVREEDEELYFKLSDFIEKAKDLERPGGKPAWTLAQFHPGLASSPGHELIHNKDYFLMSEKNRNVGLGRFM